MRQVFRALGGCGAVLAVSVVLFAQQSQHELFERARLLEDSNQDLAEAVSLYGQVVDQAGGERALAATAQLRVGLIYERLGRIPDAQRALEAVVSEFADQGDLARQAQARIAALAPGHEGSGVILREVNINPTEVSFALSPDGNQVVYTGPGRALVIRDLTTGSDRTIASGLRPVWSPDGTQVAYTNWQNYWTHELQIVSVETGEEQHREINGFTLGWSGDGRFILYGEGFFTQGDPIFNLLPVSAGPSRTLNLAFDKRGRGGMSLSPDAKYFVYGGETADNWDLYVMPVEGGTPSHLTDDPGVDREPVWSPDGHTILFKSNRSLGRWDLWAVRVEEGRRASEPFVIRPDIGDRTTVHTWSESGKLLFSTDEFASSVYVVPTSAETNQPEGRAINLTADAKNSGDPIWSPDGTQIAYFSNDVLTVMLADGTGPQEIATGLSKFTGPFAWAADGQHLLVPATIVSDDDRRPAIYSVSVRTGKITPIFEDQEILGHLARSPDGRRIVFLKGLRHPQLFSVDRDGTNLQQLTFDEESSVYNPAFSPDGREIAVQRSANGTRSISVIPATGGEPRVLVDSDDHDQGEFLGWPAWAPDGSQIVYGTFAREDGAAARPRLWVISTSDESQPQELHIDLGPSGQASMLAQPQWSPDGTQMVFTAGTQAWQLWVMEHFLPEAP